MANDDPRREQVLEERIRELEAENQRLRHGPFTPRHGETVRVPGPWREIFLAAQDVVRDYFGAFDADPSQGTIEIAGERYLLIRASALSHSFMTAVRTLYADRGDAEALRIGKTLLFDMAHVIGAADARNFHRKMDLTDPVAKLSAGPVHFAFAGWAFVEILPESRPEPDDDFFLTFRHPFSFESHSWLEAGKRTEFTVCTMGAGYASGWCEESFGFPLSATEITCKAKGDEHCQFVLAPPHRLRDHVERAIADLPDEERTRIVHDIPTLFERKQVEEQLKDALRRAEAASEAKSRFLANMSHEIRTPLTGVLGMATLLLRQELDATQRDYVQTIDQSGQALLSVLNDILDVAKVEAGMMTVTKAPCDVRRVFDEVSTVLRARVEEKGLGFSADVDPSVPAFIESDPIRLRQVVLNLAANATKFTDRGEIRARARWSSPGTLHVEVEDSGIGIEAGDIERLFEDFTQADSSPSRRYPGTGLGLSIARRFVGLLGGEMAVASEVGRGSTFSFTVSALPIEGEPPAPSPSTIPLLRRGAHVLLVEDDRVARYVVEKLLEDDGLLVGEAVDGQAGVEAWEAGNYDLVLMDCQMPVLDGYAATRRIRALEGDGPRTPIVAMTASVLRSDSRRCREAGMDDFVAKPIAPDELREALARWIPATDSV